MKDLKNIRVIAILLVFIFASCSKEEGETAQEDSGKASISFNTLLQNVSANRLMERQSSSGIPECSSAEPATAVALLSLDGVDMDPVTVNILSDDLDDDGNLEYYTDYSDDLELDPDVYMLEEFVVYDEEGSILWVAPRIGEGTEGLEDFIDNPLPISINLSAGVKKYIDVEVLCYDERMANEYGYPFFELVQDRVYDLCFFAQYCFNNVVYAANYSLELYYVREGEEDIQLYPQNDVPVTPSTGIDEEGEYYADPLCVKIPAPQYGEADDEGYLFFRITLIDWPENYGDIVDGAITREGYITWDLIEILRDTDDNPATEDTDMRFLQFYLNCSNPGGGDCIPTPQDENGDCIPDNLNQYGYLFYDLEPTEIIDFCLFGNYCTPNGRHYPASYSIDVWKYEEGEVTIQLYDNLLSEVTMVDGEYSAEPLCINLPDGSGEDEYYFEITIHDTDEYDVEEEIIRAGVITDAEVRALFSGESNVEYYHFFYGCDLEDDPALLNSVPSSTEE
ncbi:hypothetical protein RM553_15645 [Zunongwangia sp. F363]|uniref:Uncharacterized protein n=1 Tax=Autumnicola tepida TaxID=3075595 RepID=A0ABU3CD44_9FLAO|nr:hypothetical protein [Zunongwangia sp. F363]MDT0644271.1 hypothetical protein [Zunongwangia sp. F363]